MSEKQCISSLDKWLETQPSENTWNNEISKYTMFAKEIVDFPFDKKPKFGDTITCTIPQNLFDLIHRMYIVIKLPPIKYKARPNEYITWKNLIGFRMLKKMVIRVGRVDLYSKNAETMINQYLVEFQEGFVGENQTLNGAVKYSTHSQELFVPVFAFGYRESTQSFPLLCMRQMSNMTVRIELNELEDCIYTNAPHVQYEVNENALNMSVMIDGTLLSSQEKDVFISSEKLTYIYKDMNEWVHESKIKNNCVINNESYTQIIETIDALHEIRGHITALSNAIPEFSFELDEDIQTFFNNLHSFVVDMHSTDYAFFYNTWDFIRIRYNRLLDVFQNTSFDFNFHLNAVSANISNNILPFIDYGQRLLDASYVHSTTSAYQSRRIIEDINNYIADLKSKYDNDSLRDEITRQYVNDISKNVNNTLIEIQSGINTFQKFYESHINNEAAIENLDIVINALNEIQQTCTNTDSYIIKDFDIQDITINNLNIDLSNNLIINLQLCVDFIRYLKETLGNAIDVNEAYSMKINNDKNEEIYKAFQFIDKDFTANITDYIPNTNIIQMVKRINTDVLQEIYTSMKSDDVVHIMNGMFLSHINPTESWHIFDSDTNRFLLSNTRGVPYQIKMANALNAEFTMNFRLKIYDDDSSTGLTSTNIFSITNPNTLDGIYFFCKMKTPADSGDLSKFGLRACLNYSMRRETIINHSDEYYEQLVEIEKYQSTLDTHISEFNAAIVELKNSIRVSRVHFEQFENFANELTEDIVDEAFYLDSNNEPVKDDNKSASIGFYITSIYLLTDPPSNNFDDEGKIPYHGIDLQIFMRELYNSVSASLSRMNDAYDTLRAYVDGASVPQNSLDNAEAIHLNWWEIIDLFREEVQQSPSISVDGLDIEVLANTAISNIINTNINDVSATDVSGFQNIVSNNIYGAQELYEVVNYISNNISSLSVFFEASSVYDKFKNVITPLSNFKNNIMEELTEIRQLLSDREIHNNIRKLLDIGDVNKRYANYMKIMDINSIFVFQVNDAPQNNEILNEIEEFYVNLYAGLLNKHKSLIDKYESILKMVTEEKEYLTSVILNSRSLVEIKFGDENFDVNELYDISIRMDLKAEPLKPKIYHVIYKCADSNDFPSRNIGMDEMDLTSYTHDIRFDASFTRSLRSINYLCDFENSMSYLGSEIINMTVTNIVDESTILKYKQINDKYFINLTLGFSISTTSVPAKVTGTIDADMYNTVEVSVDIQPDSYKVILTHYLRNKSMYVQEVNVTENIQYIIYLDSNYTLHTDSIQTRLHESIAQALSTISKHVIISNVDISEGVQLLLFNMNNIPVLTTSSDHEIIKEFEDKIFRKDAYYDEINTSIVNSLQTSFDKYIEIQASLDFSNSLKQELLYIQRKTIEKEISKIFENYEDMWDYVLGPHSNSSLRLYALRNTIFTQLKHSNIGSIYYGFGSSDVDKLQYSSYFTLTRNISQLQNYLSSELDTNVYIKAFIDDLYNNVSSSINTLNGTVNNACIQIQKELHVVSNRLLQYERNQFKKFDVQIDEWNASLLSIKNNIESTNNFINSLRSNVKTDHIHAEFAVTINSVESVQINIKNINTINNITSLIMFRNSGMYDIVSNIGYKYILNENNHRDIHMNFFSDYLSKYPYSISHFDLYPRSTQPSGSLNISALKSYALDIQDVPKSIYPTHIHVYSMSMYKMVFKNGQINIDYI